MHIITKFDTVEDSLEYVDEQLSGLDLYEFGVFNGNTLGRLIKGFADKNIDINHVWGFDSFSGIPAEDPNVFQNEEWPEGAFSIQKDYNLKSVNEAVQFVYNRLQPFNTKNNITLIPGFYSDILNNYTTLDYSLGYASYIHVDCDIYLSSWQVLQFVFKNSIPTRGTIVRFDDIASTPINGGQHLAWDKCKYKFSIEFEQLSYNCFRILHYNMEK